MGTCWFANLIQSGNIAQLPKYKKFNMSYITRTIRNSKYAIEGCITFVKEEFSAKIQLLFDALAIGTGIWLRLDRVEWMFVLSTIFLGWAVEAINSSIERLVDLITQDHHPLAKKAKDLAASATFFICCIATVLFISIYLPKIGEKVQ
jgi:diacylglycerol kinase